ncbi:MAG: oxidoreductase [Acetobacteraceae bacterium]|nr:oxidoreductase [Acetobacteraceae bacterium]
MDRSDFRALVLSQEGKQVHHEIRRVPLIELPAGDTTVAISHSTLNYKDGMILRGLGRLVRSYPHVPGIDFAGEVTSSGSGRFRPGDKVILTGWRVGETHWGGYAELARVKSEWLVKLPPGLTPARAMAVGTAGLTSMLAIEALERHGLKSGGDAELLVTGASGGVGSMAVAMAAQIGYRVAASTGRMQEEGYLRDLGAQVIVPRQELESACERPLLAERWAGAVDAVGGKVLAGALPQLRYGGSISVCGLAGGNELHTTVIPFLLRGVNLLGIDSVMQPLAARESAWKRIAETVPGEVLDKMSRIVRLEDVAALADEILKGRVRGRVVVEIGSA